MVLFTYCRLFAIRWINWQLPFNEKQAFLNVCQLSRGMESVFYGFENENIMTIEQAMAKLQYLSYNVTLESGEQMIILEKDDVFEVLDKVVKNCSIPDVGKRFSCTCAEPVPNYPEMLWCDCCGKPIEQKVRIKLDEGSASVQRYVSGETKHALNEMVKRVRKIFES